ncbi:acyl-CoA-binding domain-containing protein 5-like isoform X2 [Girardinichthys multiradiatus]|uniref:acyl-CoA-binding domain-containing protein 5-like isoform X2 n=1 Tax=Girardinichthys multiradiatus TaxID=208333 RepID=UPI001FADC015|nr:acyl-CoA-binding domain-containing protein 5-like isoform X2 [Girardinichthys multiradiatus]
MSSLCGLSMAQEEEEEEDEHSLETKFAAAVKVIRSLPEEGPFQPSDDMMMMFCSYYKQATIGPCHIPRPTGFWDSRGKAKWDAWSSLGNMTKEEAMKNYVEHIQLILETIPISEEVTELVQRLGNFYTEVDGEEEEEGNQVDKRPFTRPFVDHAGYGDLWEDIQNPQEKGRDGSVLGRTVSREEAEGSKEIKEESGVWSKNKKENWNDDFGGNNVEIRDWDQDPRFLTVDDRRWRSDTKGSSSSIEPSMSSFTNGTHSSLNSEVEEEELACSIEPGVPYNPCMHLNGYFNDDCSVNPERNHRPADSDNEEFCDSMEHLAMEERLPPSKGRSPGSGATSLKTNDVWFESSTTLKDAEDDAPAGDFYIKERVCPSKHSRSISKRRRGCRSTITTCSPLRCVSADAACGCVLQSRHPVTVTRGNNSEQIAAALLRLQHNMANVLHRLRTLEELTRSQSRSPSPRQEAFLPVAQKFLRPSWWPFHLPPITMMLAALWPLITHWLVQLYFQRKRRKIP